MKGIDYPKHEHKHLIKMLKKVNFQVFVWCAKCERVTQHYFPNKTSKAYNYSNLLECYECYGKKCEKASNKRSNMNNLLQQLKECDEFDRQFH